MFENSLIGSIYPTSPPVDESEASERGAKMAMMRTVAERGKYHYRYDEYLLFSLLRSFCCCFIRADSKGCCSRRLRRLERHEEASEKLAEELDIVKLIYVQRIGQFVAKLILKKHQRALVTSFKKYQIDDLKQAEETSDNLNDYGRTSSKLLEPTIQEDGTVDDLAEFSNNVNLTKD